MKISFMPRYGRSAASSRLRVYALADAINAYGMGEAVLAHVDDANVLVVQKAVDHSTFALARKYPGKVIYDVDDFIDESILYAAAACADMITTDTPGRADDIRKRLPGGFKVKSVAVIPDSLDYESSGPAAPAELDDHQSAVWFGNYPNFESARWMVAALEGRARLGAISDLSQETAAASAQFTLRPWSLETFPEELRKWGMALLSHKGADPNKSSNKMAAAYHLGVPCIVSGSEEYRQLAEDCDLGWTYVRERSGLLAAYERLSDPIERSQAVLKAQPVVWKRFHAKAVAEHAVKVWASA